MQERRYPFKAMGSPCELRLYGDNADAAAEAGIAEVQRLERKYSRYRDDSVVSIINASAGDPDGVEVDDETAGLLDYAQVSWEQSEGLFDITSGILRRVWDFKSGRLPSRADVDAVRAHIGWQHVRWERPRIALPDPEMELDFGGYGKEYAADRVAELCRQRGLRHGLIDLGGDLAVVGPHPDGSPWRVGIRHPRRPEIPVASIPLHTGGIATSGDYERYMVIDGRRYAHILSPHTGWPVESLASISVVADRALVAGTATTIAMLKGPSAGAAWLDELGLPNLRVDGAGELSGSLRAA